MGSFTLLCVEQSPTGLKSQCMVLTASPRCLSLVSTNKRSEQEKMPACPREIFSVIMCNQTCNQTFNKLLVFFLLISCCQLLGLKVEFQGGDE